MYQSHVAPRCFSDLPVATPCSQDLDDRQGSTAIVCEVDSSGVAIRFAKALPLTLAQNVRRTGTSGMAAESGALKPAKSFRDGLHGFILRRLAGLLGCD
jgi:hypothetical protein